MFALYIIELLIVTFSKKPRGDPVVYVTFKT